MYLERVVSGEMTHHGKLGYDEMNRHGQVDHYNEVDHQDENHEMAHRGGCQHSK